MQFPDEPVSNPSAIRIEDLLAADDAAPVQPVPAREGLPRSFRMRADKHYVEMLDTPPQPVATEPAASAPSTTERETEAPDHEAIAAAIQAGRDLAQALASLRASTNLLSERGPALASSVAGNLIRAEAWRATCLLQVSRFLRGEITARPKPVRVQAVVDEVLKSIEPERRLRSISVEDRVNVGESAIVADEELLVCALSGLLMATMALNDEPSFVVTITAELRRNAVDFAIVQDQTRPSSNWATGWPAASAARILATCDGQVAMTATATGTDIRIVVPRPS